MSIEPKLNNRNFSRVSLILPIYIPAFLLAIGGGIVSPTLSIYVKSFELSYTLTTVVLAVGVLGNIPAGILVERLGRKPSMLLGLVLIGLSTLGMGMARNFFQLIGAQLLGGIGYALWMLARHAYMTDVIPIANRGRALALFGGVNRMGTFAGQFCSIFLGVNLRLPFFIYAGIVILNLFLCFFFIPETRRATTEVAGKRTPYLKQLLEISRQHARLLATAGVGQVCVQTLRRGCNIIIPLYADEVVGLTTQQVRSVVMISSAVDMSMFPIAGHMMDRFGRRYATVAWMHAAFNGTHPFPDGNGRTGRLLMAWVYLRRNEHPPLIATEDRAEYFQAMRKAHRGEIEPLRTLIHESAAVMMELSGRVRQICGASGDEGALPSPKRRRMKPAKSGTVKSTEPVRGA